MKKLLLPLLFLCPLFLTAQWSVSAEYSLDPFKSLIDNEYVDYQEEQSIIKEINFGINYKLPKLITLRAGVARLEKRNASSVPFFQDFFISGSFPQFINLTLSHTSGIRNYSAFAGLQFDFNRLHILSHLHYSTSIFRDEAISAREFTTFTGEAKVTLFEIDYENIIFFKGDLNISYDLVKTKKGTISIVLKYMKDYSEDKSFTVKNYSPELREMVENFPGSSYYNIDDFLAGGPLFYDRAFWGVGVRMTYNLVAMIY